MTATAAAYCASNPIVYVHIVPRKSPAAPIFRLTALPSPPPSNISSLETSPLKGIQRSDSHEDTRRPTPAIVLRRLPSTTDQRDPSFNETEIEQILTGVGLRRRTTQRVAPPPQRLRPLTKRLAVPVCLLPLKTNAERIRHALSIVLPYLKFLSIPHDLESFCLTDASIFVESLPSRSGTQMRSVLTTTTKTTTKTIKRKTKRHFTSKADFVALAGESLHQSVTGIPMNKHVRSALNCHVVLDRLDEFAIDQIMKNSNRPLNRNTSLRAISQQLAVKTPSNRNALNRTTTKTTTTRTTITTLTTEETTVKQKSTRTSFNPAKRLKTSNDDCVLLPSSSSSSSSSAPSYQRIYLKCFICSKREYIDARLTTSDALHLHWLEHGNDLSLNIYDSVIDSTLTRVVEFFHFPKQHTLEGKIQTVFILNSEEVRQSRPLSASADDTCIVLD